MTTHQILQPLIDAWTQSLDSVRDLCAPLTEGDWNRPTECPGWSVRDVVSHIIGTELGLLGDPRPIHTLPRDLRHVKDEKSRYNEVPVDVRRCHTGPEMTSELELLAIRRGRSLRETRHGPDDEILGLMGRPMRQATLLRFRVLDVWVHEQDLRRALHVPGNLDSAAAQITRDLLVSALPDVVRSAGPPQRSAVVLDVHGPLEFMRTVRVDARGEATVGEQIALAPDLSLSMDWETYSRLACGRIRPNRAEVKIDGDQALAARVLQEFAITE